jgi:hypothetical protein
MLIELLRLKDASLIIALKVFVYLTYSFCFLTNLSSSLFILQFNTV